MLFYWTICLRSTTNLPFSNFAEYGGTQFYVHGKDRVCNSKSSSHFASCIPRKLCSINTSKSSMLPKLYSDSYRCNQSDRVLWVCECAAAYRARLGFSEREPKADIISFWRQWSLGAIVTSSTGACSYILPAVSNVIPCNQPSTRLLIRYLIIIQDYTMVQTADIEGDSTAECCNRKRRTSACFLLYQGWLWLGGSLHRRHYPLAHGLCSIVSSQNSKHHFKKTRGFSIIFGLSVSSTLHDHIESGKVKRSLGRGDNTTCAHSLEIDHIQAVGEASREFSKFKLHH